MKNPPLRATLQKRRDSLMPNGIPRKVRCYDNGGATIDRYTVVFTGNYRQNTLGYTWVLGMSGRPFHPQGFCQHNEYRRSPDYPTYRRFGKRIKFTDLPEDCQNAVIDAYRDLWSLKACWECGMPAWDDGSGPYCQRHREERKNATQQRGSNPNP